MKTGDIILICVFSCIAIILIGHYFNSVSFTGKVTCNTGFVGLDIEAYNNIQNKTCDYNNYTCFKEDMLLEHIKIKNIDGLNCNIDYVGKLPGNLISLIGGI